MQKYVSLQDKAKTIVQLNEDLKDWEFLFRQGAHGNQEAYNRARDTRPLFEEKLWVRLEDAQQEIEDCRISWQNLKNTIPKFDAKIAYLEQQLKNSEELAETLRKERGEWKEKLQRWFEDLGRWLYSQRKDWSHPELPEELKKQFMELLK